MIYNEPGETDGRLPRPLADAIAGALMPVDASSRIESVRGRLMDRVRAESKPQDMARALASAFITHRASTDGQSEGWVEMLPKAHAKLLYTDGEAESYMIRLEPGAWAPAHEHPADEECLVLEGSLWQGDVFLEAGDFHVARPGMKHGDLRTDTGALVFIRYGKPLAQYLQM